MNSGLSYPGSLLDADRLSLVGVAKNCGKTTTLMSLIEHRPDELAAPSLVSIGIDGEAEDALLGTKKPPVRVQKGQWVASAGRLLQRSTARVEYVQSLGVDTPVGRVYVCRVVDDGTVTLAGLRHRRELIRAVNALQQLGPGPVWVDGAYGRLMGAHPDVSRSVVVATGAVVADDITGVVERTDHLVSRLQTDPVADDAHRRAIEDAVAQNRLLFVGDNGDTTAPSIRSAVTGLGEALDQFDGSIDAVAIPGLVSDRVAEQLLTVDDATLLVPDPTVLHVDPGLWRRLHDRWNVQVLHPVEPVAVSYNPTSVDGTGVDARRLHRALSERFDDLVVFDPCRL